MGTLFTTKHLQESQLGQWKTVILSGIVTLLVTVVAGLVVFFVEARTPHLKYAVTTGMPFTGKGKTILTGQLAVSNDGKSAAENVVAIVETPGAKIEQDELSIDPASEYSKTTGDDSLRLTVPTLNPSETVRMSFIASSTGKMAPFKISVRGKGLSGTSDGSDGGSVALHVWQSIALASVFGLAITWFAHRNQRRGPNLWRLPRSFNQWEGHEVERHTMANILNIVGLHDEASELARRPTSVSYWSEADQLTQLGISEHGSNKSGKIIRALEYFLDYTHAQHSTTAIINLDLAKLYISLSRGETAENKALAAMIDCDSIIQTRVKQDEPLRELLQNKNS